MLKAIKNVISTRIILISTIVFAIFVSACSEDKLSFSKKLLAQSGHDWELTSYVDEYSGQLSSGVNYTVIRARGKLNDGENFTILLQYSESDGAPKLKGFHLQSRGLEFADGLIAYQNGKVTSYTKYMVSTF